MVAAMSEPALETQRRAALNGPRTSASWSCSMLATGCRATPPTRRTGRPTTSCDGVGSPIFDHRTLVQPQPARDRSWQLGLIMRNEENRPIRRESLVDPRPRPLGSPGVQHLEWLVEDQERGVFHEGPDHE